MRIEDIENSVNFYFDKKNKEKFESMWDREISVSPSGTRIMIMKFNGLRHSRNGKPSFEEYEKYSWTKAWHYRGMLHRTDGPSVIRSNGRKEYWLEDMQYSKETWEEIKEEIKEWYEYIW